ncbi:MAG: radical SAM protein [Candidatus Aenigmatarchaeota archaeon]
MDLVKKIDLGKDFVISKLFGIKKPLIVTYSVTGRCNSKCKYCGIRDNINKEGFSHEEAMALIGEMGKLGTKKLVFTGGEPLLRDDIGTLISKAGNLGISVSLNSNGILLPQKIEDVKNVDFLVLSLDGPKEVNNDLRGNGSYEKVMESLDIAKEYGINVGLTTVLTKKNVDKLDFLFDIARDKDVSLNFQPFVEHISPTMNKEIKIPNEELKLNRDELNGVIEKVKEFKMEYDNLIRPSINTLEKILDIHFSSIKPNCGKGIIHYRIERRYLIQCPRVWESEKIPMENGFQRALEKISKNPSCSGKCCTSALELFNIWNFDLKTIINQIVNDSF